MASLARGLGIASVLNFDLGIEQTSITSMNVLGSSLLMTESNKIYRSLHELPIWYY